MPDSPSVIVVGGGAAGFFAAIEAARQGCRVAIYERGREPLAKVRISGGGRCNVTHACFDPRLLTSHYPRGGRELLGPFHHFGPTGTVDWFAQEGVALKTEEDGRMFPVTDQSATIIAALQDAFREAGGTLHLRDGIRSLEKGNSGKWSLRTESGELLEPAAVIIAVGSLASSPLTGALTELGHTIVPPVPSLFTFKVVRPLVGDLAGVSVPEATVSTSVGRSHQKGPLLFTHWGLSGPAVLKTSAWQARELAAVDYRFTAQVAYTPHSPETLREMWEEARRSFPRRAVANQPLAGLPRRLWQALCGWAGVDANVTTSQLPGPARDALLGLISAHSLEVNGKSTHKEEFVTCGGISLREVNFKSMESRRCPGLFFAGECLDLDGVTGGFNFQAAWTTGYLAGQAAAGLRS